VTSIQDVLLEPEEHVLSTLERDGSRRWLKPRISRGRYLTWRRVVAYVLIAVFTGLPFLQINGKQALFLDVGARRFTILGYTFLPTDTLLLALFLVFVLVGFFLATALFGRVWCGWACPQTVYLEFVFRPLERLLEGTAGRGGSAKKPVAAWRLVVKYALFLVVSLHLANTFLCYFVGTERLAQWTRQSPLEHPVPFLIVAAVTGLMLFDFGYFREQLCIIACPYGRLQSVLLDQNSLIVSYDSRRGEPRGHAAKTRQTASPRVIGDCVDCRLCVTTCPTGIDIRQGLQMECINCTQCMDACDAVMNKLGRPLGLIRYSSQAADRGSAFRLLRARTLVYPLVLVGVAALFAVVLVNKKCFNAIILREPGNLHSLTSDGLVQNLMRLKLTNRRDSPDRYRVTLLEPAGATSHFSESELGLEPNQTQTFHLQILCPRARFRNGQSAARLRVESSGRDAIELDFKLIGPFARSNRGE
jgi:cytochrome c oxidase accessory protein FixG